jgi:hypothetical protein
MPDISNNIKIISVVLGLMNGFSRSIYTSVSQIAKNICIIPTEHLLLYYHHSPYYNLSNVCLSVRSPTPPGSLDQFPPNLVHVCRLTPELTLRGLFWQRSMSLGSKAKFVYLSGPWTDFHQTWYMCVGLARNYHRGVCFGKGQGLFWQRSRSFGSRIKLQRSRSFG